MKYCHYHPDTAATYYCPNCQVHSCDTCSNESINNDTTCLYCNTPLEDLGSGYAAEPFWRRLDKTFAYALNAEVLIFILVVAILGSILHFSRFGLILQLMLTGVFIKYCFVCLESTALGQMQPPSVTEGYQDGLIALFKLFFLFLGLFGLGMLAIMLLGKSLGALIILALICAVPAAIITLAINNSVLKAINPLNLWRIITSVGLPYGLLLAFIMIMTSSVAVLHNLTGTFFLGTIAQSFFSNFYSVVMFHMMGYMIFQYQHNIGFVARDADQITIRTEVEKAKAKLNLLIRKGEFDALITEYSSVLKKHPNDLSLAKQYFDFLMSTQNTQALNDYGSTYLHLLVKQNQLFDIPIVYKKIKHMVPSYLPATPQMRHMFAKQFHEAGDIQLAISLLTNLHKDFPNYGALPDAYRFCADMLETLPNQTATANKLRQYSQSVEKKRQQQALLQTPASTSVKKATQNTKQANPNTQTATDNTTEPTQTGLSLVAKDAY